MGTGSDPVKAELIETFKKPVVLYDRDGLLRAVKQVDVVISTLSVKQFADQVRFTLSPPLKSWKHQCWSLDKPLLMFLMLSRIIQRFFPSALANDVDRTNAVEPTRSAVQVKASQGFFLSRRLISQRYYNCVISFSSAISV